MIPTSLIITELLKNKNRERDVYYDKDSYRMTQYSSIEYDATQSKCDCAIFPLR